MVEVSTIAKPTYEPLCKNVPWQKTGIKEPCPSYMEKALKRLPELKSYFFEFQDSLIDRARCYGTNWWCGENSPVYKIDGVETEFTIPKDEIDEIIKSSYPPEEVVYIAKELYPNYVITPVRGEITRLKYRDKETEREGWIKISKMLKDLNKKKKEMGEEYKKAFWVYSSRFEENMLADVFLNKYLTTLPPKKDLKLKIRISADPVDVISKSTRQFWESCETLGGSYCQGVWSDVENWNGIAWLYLEGSNKPIARVMLRNCEDVDKGDGDVGIEPRVYVKRYGLWSFEDYLVRKFTKKLKKILKERGLLDYDACVTPYVYEGYSDQMGESDTKICYGNEYRCDDIIRGEEEGDFEAELESELDSWDFDAYLYNDDWYSYEEMFTLVNLKDYLRDMVEYAEDDLYDRWVDTGYIPDLDTYFDISYFSDNDYDVRIWRRYPEKLEEFKKYLEDAGVELAVVYDPEPLKKVYTYTGRGVVVDPVPRGDDQWEYPDNFDLVAPSDYEEGYDLIDDFNSCVTEKEEELKKRKSRIGTDKVRKEAVSYCMREELGLIPLKEVIKKGLSPGIENKEYKELLNKSVKFARYLGELHECKTYAEQGKIHDSIKDMVEKEKIKDMNDFDRKYYLERKCIDKFDMKVKDGFGIDYTDVPRKDIFWKFGKIYEKSLEEFEKEHGTLKEFIDVVSI